jgi:hypothetical protein
MQTGSNRAFVVPDAGHELLKVARLRGLTMKRARNSDIEAFHLAGDGPNILYLEDQPSFASLPPDVQRHMNKSRTELEARAAYQRGDCLWWRFTWPLHQEFVHAPRILAPYRARDNRFAVDEEAAYIGLTDTTVLYDKGQPESLHYLAAVLNSTVLTFRFRYIGKLVGGGTYEYFHNSIGKLAIPRLSPGDRLHDALASLSGQVHEEKETLSSTRVPHEREQCLARIADCRARIDDFVSELYGLSTDERTLIAEAVSE